MATQYYTASSLDGFMATADHSLDWLLQFGMPEDSTYPAFIQDVGAIAMGSATYEWLLHHLADANPTKDAAWPYQQPAWVFSTRQLPAVPGADIRFVQGDVRAVHHKMTVEAAEKNLWIVGGGELAGQFYDHGLLDELIISLVPVTLGSGIPVFPRDTSGCPLRLKSMATFGDAFAELRYAVR